MLRTYLFFLSDSGVVEPVARDDYVRLVRGEQRAPQYGGRTVRVADWYVKVSEGDPVEVENETYTFLAFDQAGRVVLHGARDGEACAWPRGREDMAGEEASRQGSLPGESHWLPTEGEREQIRGMIFPPPGR